jgi:predicted transcriptional regulator
MLPLLRRSRDEILFGILKSCAADKLSINELLRVQNLSYKLLKSSLEQLANSGLVVVEKENERTLVNTTQEGLDALAHYRRAAAMVKANHHASKHQTTVKF